MHVSVHRARGMHDEETDVSAFGKAVYTPPHRQPPAQPTRRRGGASEGEDEGEHVDEERPAYPGDRRGGSRGGLRQRPGRLKRIGLRK